MEDDRNDNPNDNRKDDRKDDGNYNRNDARKNVPVNGAMYCRGAGKAQRVRNTYSLRTATQHSDQNPT